MERSPENSINLLNSPQCQSELRFIFLCVGQRIFHGLVMSKDQLATYNMILKMEKFYHWGQIFILIGLQQ